MIRNEKNFKKIKTDLKDNTKSGTEAMSKRTMKMFCIVLNVLL